VEQRKKGAKPPFFRKTTQGQSKLQEPKVSKIVGKKLRKQPMQCWGCGGNHMHKYFRQRGDKVRTVHSVHQATIMEDMGINVQRIYIALDNKQAEFQSHMIEVEGMINDQSISILIDSGASYSYLDPKMVE
jgi:hypothetical protein